jgi:hypothetical protein
MAELQIKAQDATTRAKEVDAKIAKGQAEMGTGQQPDPIKIAELAIQKQDADTRAKAADAKMMLDVSLAQLQVARFEFEKVFVDECHGSAEIEKESMPDKGEMVQ